MSGPDLPEDVSKWPRDPYAVLGVERNCTEVDLKKAYGALIRRFKPEHHPEQFRLIREAYDQAKMFLSWSAAPLPDFAAGTEIAPQFTTETHDELASIDKAIREGRAEEAFSALKRLVDRQGVHPAVSARLFWLTAMHPALDADHDRTHWLIAGLRHSPHDFRAKELLRRTVEEYPREAMTAAFLDWAQTLPPGYPLFEALAWRWRAAATLERWIVIAEDIERLAPIGRGEELFWARIRFLALDYLIWQEVDYLHGLCEKWVEELQADSGLHNSLQNELHRLDVLLDLYHDVMKLESLAGMERIAHVAARSWYQPILEYRPMLYALMEDLLQDVTAGLETLDQIMRVAPLLVGQLMRAFDGLRFLNRRPGREEPLKRPLLKAIEEYFGRFESQGYPQFRVALLYFCMREYVEIPALISLLAGRQFPQQIAQNLTWSFEDGPLICMVQAHCLFWQ